MVLLSVQKQGRTQYSIEFHKIPWDSRKNEWCDEYHVCTGEHGDIERVFDTLNDAQNYVAKKSSNIISIRN